MVHGVIFLGKKWETSIRYGLLVIFVGVLDLNNTKECKQSIFDLTTSMHTYKLAYAIFSGPTTDKKKIQNSLSMKGHV